MTSKQHSRIFIFDSTRLRSHLFFRYISTHPSLAPIYHPYLTAATFGPEHVPQHLEHSQARKDEIEQQSKTIFGTDTYASNERAFLEAIQEAESNGKIPIANEHWLNIFTIETVLNLIRGSPIAFNANPTVLPDSVFDSFTPIILIRHPALIVDSIYRGALAHGAQRPGDEDFELLTSVKGLRLLRDFLAGRGQRPIVVDGEDLLWLTEEVSVALCDRLGLDPEGLSETWPPASEEEVARMNPLLYALTKDIQLSSGIQRPDVKPSEPSIAQAVQKWRELYGEEVACQLKDYADRNMPHYDYLRQFKI